ncbi:OLC1v1035261C1 [Oldenlandia corymbosa var. corymbosa]|uniref:OLC1v1035261C1 n=1 Tax=Oldenlandia corymbosa var. corymbosa TaxID=529605 RepID=A0AAV1CT31_OLDCO|nr:OLC1v1035261C1 [Oldenlandia corymbosa var. corymbosa]
MDVHFAIHSSAAKTMGIAQSPSSSATGSTVPRSPWHSPVPYLFGGLAAMLGLIAFALLILACSYWRLSGYLESGSGNGERDLESGEGEAGSDENDLKKTKPVFEEKFLVIMPGQEKPTCLATPMSSRASSFGSTGSCNSSCSSTSSASISTESKKEEENDDFSHQDVEMGRMDDHRHVTNQENQVS